MCGRAACVLSTDRCRRVAGRGTARKVRGAEKLRPRYNLGPQGYVPVVRQVPSNSRPADTGQGAGMLENEVPGREVCIMRWGLVPSFAKRMEDYDVFKGGSSTFNARLENAASSGLWRRLLDAKRCVVLFDGFFEWKTTGKSKVPMFIRHCDDYGGHVINALSEAEPDEPSMGDSDADGLRHAPLLLAGLYDVWNASQSLPQDKHEDVETVTILTMEPDGTPMAAVHDRMPVFLTPETAALWLDPSAKWTDIVGTVAKSSQAHAQSQLLLQEVSSLVSNIKNESADCILPKKDYEARQLSKGIGRFFQKKAAQSGSDQTPLSEKRKASPEPESSAKAVPADGSDLKKQRVGGSDAEARSLSQLLDMGFPEAAAKRALATSGGKVDAAVEQLTSKCS